MAKAILRAGKVIALVIGALAAVFLGVLAVWVHAELGYPVEPEAAATLGYAIEDESPVILSEERYEIVEKRSVNQRVWEIVRNVEVPDALTAQPTVQEVTSTVVQVGDGICYQDPEGQWQVADTRWQAVSDGFVIDTAGYKLSIGTTLGTWLEYQVEGHSMFLMPSEIIAYDGTYVETIAVLNETAEAVIDPNDATCLVFADAFGPGVDVTLQARPGGYHQNVVFHREPVLRQPFEPSETEVMVYTAINLETYAETGSLQTKIGMSSLYNLVNFDVVSPGPDGVSDAINAMEPTLDDITFVRKDTDINGETSRQLHRFGKSEVFDSGELAGRKEDVARKQIWRDGNGHTYLIERLDHRFFHTASYPVVWDYSTVYGTLTTDTVWYASNTYFVDPCGLDVTVDNCELKIEPGTIVKMGAYGGTVRVSNGGRIIAKGKPYLPIVFTSAKDDENGESLGAYGLGDPQGGDYDGLVVEDGSEVEYCSFFYAGRAVEVEGPGVIDIQHNRFYWVEQAVYVYDPCEMTAGDSVTIFNNLMIADPCNCSAMIEVNGGSLDGQGAVWIRNNTIHGAYIGIRLYDSSTTIVAINNILSGCVTGVQATSIGNSTFNYNGYYNNTTDFDIPYASKGGDSRTVTSSPFYSGQDFYLDETYGADFLDVGPSSPAAAGYTNPSAWSIHYPKHEFTSSTQDPNTLWKPEYDTCDDDSLVDLGYHYPRVDYVIHVASGNLTVSGSGLIVQAGTVVAHEVDSSSGAGKLIVEAGSSLVCVGEPFEDGYVTWVSCDRIQWEAAGCVPRSNTQNFVEFESGSSYDISFTRFLGLGMALVPSEGGGIIRDSIFMLNVRGVDYQNCDGFKVENCLFMGNNMGVRAYHYSGAGKSGEVTNCTFDHNLYGVVMPGTVAASLTVKDCLFHTNITESGVGHGISYRNSYATLTEYYNSFYGNNYDIYDTVTSLPVDTDPNLDQTPVNDPYDPDWTDFADRYRLDQTGDTVDNGSLATGGMIGYTTALNDVEDSNELDIGFHYPCSNDTDGDGLYDYQEFWLGTDRDNVDTDGDGLVDGYGGIVTVAMYPDGIDADGDGYIDGEVDAGTEPADADTDDDGIPDGWEILYDLDPLDDSDGASYLTCYQSGDDPTDAADDVQAVLFSGSGTESVIRGLTIRYAGGAAVKTANSANSTIERCIIENASYGILCANSEPTIVNNKIRAVTNHGIRSMNSVATIKNNLIYNNGLGIAIAKNDSASSEIINNTIVDNSLGLTRLFGTLDTPNVSLVNCIICCNDANIGLFFSPTYCCIPDWTGGGTGNFSSPGFAMGTYSLDAGSDCIDGGYNQTGQDGEKDIDLIQPRIIDGDGDETHTVDVGADEYDPPS